MEETDGQEEYREEPAAAKIPQVGESRSSLDPRVSDFGRCRVKLTQRLRFEKLTKWGDSAGYIRRNGQSVLAET